VRNKYPDPFETVKLWYMFHLYFIGSIIEEAEFFFVGKNVTPKKD
jgi:hypothetical protein